MTRALADVVVVDMTTAFWASLGVALLGDFGAEVIKVEKLSDTRERPLDGRDQPPAWSYDFELANRNKLSLSVNLDLPQGRQVLERLVLKADVFITDAPFARLHEQGLDYETLTRLKPDLVYAQASGFGPKG